MRYATEKEKKELKKLILELRKNVEKERGGEVSIDTLFNYADIKLYSGSSFDDFVIYDISDNVEKKVSFVRQNLYNLYIQMIDDAKSKFKKQHIYRIDRKYRFYMYELLDVDNECICYDYNMINKKK